MGDHLKQISIAEENTRMNKEKRVMLEIADILLKENLITLNEKIQLTILIKEGRE